MGTVTEALSYDGPAASTVEVRVTPIRDSMEGSTVDDTANYESFRTPVISG